MSSTSFLDKFKMSPEQAWLPQQCHTHNERSATPERPWDSSEFHMKGRTDEPATKLCKYVAENAAAEGEKETHIWTCRVLKELCGKHRVKREVGSIQGKRDGENDFL